MSGEKDIHYQVTDFYREQQELRIRNEYNKRRAQQLIKELETAIQENKKRGADRLAKKQLEKAERLHKSLESNIGSENDSQNNYTAIVNQEREITQACEDLENTVIEQSQKEERQWSLPMKKMFELERKMKSKVTSDADTDDLLDKWKRNELSDYSAKLETIRSNIENKLEEPEKIYYQLRDMEKEYETLITDANRIEEKSIEREMLIETIESAFTSPEMQFDVRIRAEEEGNPYSPIILEAWRPGDEMIEMTFELDNPSNFIDTYATGFAGPGYPAGCDTAYETLAQQLVGRGLEIRTFQDGKPLNPNDEAYRSHPSQHQQQTGSGKS